MNDIISYEASTDSPRRKAKCSDEHQISMDQPGEVANSATDELRARITFVSLSRSRLRIWFRETSSVVPSRTSLLILHNRAKSGAYSRPDFFFFLFFPCSADHGAGLATV